MIPVDNGSQPRGKQTLYPGGIMYTSSSGIWRSVWLEPVQRERRPEPDDRFRTWTTPGCG